LARATRTYKCSEAKKERKRERKTKKTNESRHDECSKNGRHTKSL